MTALTYDEDIVDLSAHEVAEEDDDADDESWHVQLAPGDVRVLSLDQLDDMYRLDLITDETMVWKDGMDAWLPLSVVLAGEDEPADSFGTTSFPPAPLAAVSFAPAPLAPLPSFAPAPLAPVSFAPAPLAPVGRAGIDPLPSFAPAPLAPVSRPPAPLAPVSFAPAPLAPVSFAPAPLAPVKSSFAPTTPPVAFSVPALPPRAGAGERWLVGLAVAAGLLATLQRNDVFSQVAQSANQGAAFTQAEQRLLGAPGFGTVRSVDALLEQHRLRLPEVRIPLAAQAAAAQPGPVEPAPIAAAPAPAAAPKAVETVKLESLKPAEAAAPAKADAVAGALRGKRVEPKAAPARAAKSVAPPPRTKSKGDSVIPGSRPTRGRSAEYDPLNGNL